MNTETNEDTNNDMNNGALSDMTNEANIEMKKKNIRLYIILGSCDPRCCCSSFYWWQAAQWVYPSFKYDLDG